MRKALSIQSHPDKQLAEKLHAEHPHLYPDDNHKPEMALVLPGNGGSGTDDGGGFEALCGFCPPEELQEALRWVPELAECVGPEAAAPLLALSGRQTDVEVGWVMNERRGETEVPISMQPGIDVGQRRGPDPRGSDGKEEGKNGGFMPGRQPGGIGMARITDGLTGRGRERIFQARAGVAYFPCWTRAYKSLSPPPPCRRSRQRSPPSCPARQPL